jgi:hypothetical protein
MDSNAPSPERPSETGDRDERGRLHLHVVATAGAGPDRPSSDRARWAVIALGALAVAAFAASFFLPWWKFWLYAPQYPKGLMLEISLTGMGGDVHEIDLLNHYIGMKHLSNAAPTERHLAGYGVAAIAVVTLAVLAGGGRRLNRWVAAPAIAFPVVFLADSFYWLYSFGHDLDPRAPLRVAAFTPELFGNGQIGQFATFARPDMGFWLALVGVAAALTANGLRSRVCAGCEQAGECSVVCPRLMVLPGRRGSL